MKLQRRPIFSAGKCVDHPGDLARNHVRCDADHPLGAQGHERQRQRVVAAQDLEPRPEHGAQLADAVGTAAGFLDADDGFAFLGQSFDGIHPDFYPAPAGNAVEHNRQAGVARYFA